MVHYGQALKSWITSQGFTFLSDFVKEKSGSEANTADYRSFYSKLNNLFKKANFSRVNWQSLALLIPELTKEELETFVQETRSQNTKTHSIRDPSKESDSKEITALRKLMLKQQRIHSEEHQRTLEMLNQIREEIREFKKTANE